MSAFERFEIAGFHCSPTTYLDTRYLIVRTPAGNFTHFHISNLCCYNKDVIYSVYLEFRVAFFWLVYS